MQGSRHAELVEALRRETEPIATSLGVELVEVSVRGSSRRRLIRFDIDRAGPQGVGIDDCKRVSDALGEALEAMDWVAESYVLEVSSPGVDRPIRDADDVRRNTGRRIVVTMREPLDGRTTFRGVLTGGDGQALTVQEDSDADAVLIPLGEIAIARQDVGF